VDRRRLYALGSALALVVAGTFAGGGWNAAAADPTAPPAPAVDGADSGGAVIVVLREQHANLKLRSQGSQRTATTRSDQSSLVADIKAHGGTDVTQLVAVNAIAAHVSAAEVDRIQRNPAVREVVPDLPLQLPQRTPLKQQTAKLSSQLCPKDPAKPFLEPEALSVLQVEADNKNDPDQASKIATGKGVIVANDGIDDLAGNPNFVRPDGSHVVIDAADYTKDDSDGEYYGDASSIAGQGLVVYDYSKELPYSGLPTGCTFRIKGVAPDASLVDTNNIDTPESGQATSESQAMAGIDYAVVKRHADVISESYGYNQQPGRYSIFYAANDAAVAAGVTVVVSSGDSGVSGTVSSPATDPLVIAVGATNTLRLNAQAYGYKSWINNDITPLSSGGTAPNNRVVDLVAPGYGGEAACSPAGSDCPTNTLTEAFGGTSQSCPLVSGAVADVIQAYADSHGGAKPTPALIKQILTSSAQDVGAPADLQGAGLLNVYAAVRAAQQVPGGAASNTSDSSSLVASTSQLAVTGEPGSTSDQQVSLYNTGNQPARVTGTYRSLDTATQLGNTVTEPVSAPDPSLPVPADGAPAATPITFTVPAGLDRLNADLIIPDPTNSTILSFTLLDPKGRLSQISYDYGHVASQPAGIGTVSNIQHVEVAAPAKGTWTAKVLWANGRSHLQEPPNVPGSYRGNVSFRAAGQHFVTAKASSPVTIPGHASVSVPLHVKLPSAPGDHPESVQFVGSNGGQTSLPVLRRTLVPTAGGVFKTQITSSVGRGIGQISTYNLDVPAGKSELDVTFHTADASADNPLTFYLIDPNGKVVTRDTTPATTLQGIGSDKPTASAALVQAMPAPGRWEIDVVLNLTASGKEFTQTVSGTAGYNGSAVGIYSLPSNVSTKVPAGSASPVSVRVTNPAGVGRSFRLTSATGDLTGGAATTPIYLAAGTTALFTANIIPTAAVGTVVHGVLYVVSNTSIRNGSQQIVGLPYAYTVGPAVGT
jgi:hypothetical protein